jgi:DNA-binding LacI/PurR family transcriptional regulator
MDALVLSSSAKDELPFPYDVPVVYIDRQLSTQSHHFVSTDHNVGALVLLEALQKDYNGKIAFVGACKDLDSSIQRFDAFKTSMQLENKVYDEDLVWHGQAHSVEAGKTAYLHFQKMLIPEPKVEESEEEDEEDRETKAETPDPIEIPRFFFTSYPLLEGFVTEMRRNDCSFVEFPLGSFDCPHSFALFPYPLICMRQDIEKIATEILISLKSRDNIHNIAIMPELLVK